MQSAFQKKVGETSGYEPHPQSRPQATLPTNVAPGEKDKDSSGKEGELFRLHTSYARLTAKAI